jgi:hypothetical protein
MALFEDVNGKAQVVSTSGSAHGVSHTTTTQHSEHKLDGSNTNFSHSVRVGADGNTITTDVTDKVVHAGGKEFHEAQVISDDGMGHRTETLTRSFIADEKGGTVAQAQSVSMSLAPGQQAVDLSRKLDEHAGGVHQPGLTYSNTTTHDHVDGKAGAHTTSVDAVTWDKVGNRSHHTEQMSSVAHIEHGNVVVDASHSKSDGHSSSQESTHKVMSLASDGRLYEESASGSSSFGASGGVSAGIGLSHTNGSGESFSTESGHGSTMNGGPVGPGNASISTGQSFSHDHSTGLRGAHSTETGLSSHVSDSLKQHLQSSGWSAHEASQTVNDVSQHLGDAIASHVRGSGGTVDFHSTGPALVSMTTGHSMNAGDSSTVSISMDRLKDVHESGFSQSLASSQGVSHSRDSGASMEMSR